MKKVLSVLFILSFIINLYSQDIESSKSACRKLDENQLVDYTIKILGNSGDIEGFMREIVRLQGIVEQCKNHERYEYLMQKIDSLDNNAKVKSLFKNSRDLEDKHSEMMLKLQEINIKYSKLTEDVDKKEKELIKLVNNFTVAIAIGIIAVSLMLILSFLFYFNRKIQKKKHIAELKAKEAEKEVLEKNYEIDKLKILETAVAGLLHDMRQSTSIIRGCSSKIQQWIDDETKTLKDDKVKYQVNKIEESIRKVVELTNNYMIIQTDRVQNESKEIILNEYIQLILNNYNSVFKKHMVQTSIVSEENIRIKLPPGFIVEILENLINNSIEHGFLNEINSNNKITIRLYRTEDVVIIEYENNGKMIDNEIIFSIFNPYFTTKKTAGFHGIGLSKVKNLVENGLGGTIICKNLENGVRFSIKLPYKQDKNEK